MIRKFINSILILSMLCAFAPCIHAAEIVDSGTCGAQGDNLTWTLDSEGTLTISGEGEMADYNYDTSPFYANSNIKSVSIGNGVTSIGVYAFDWCRDLTSITIPNSVTSIDDFAFSDCGITNITLPETLERIGRYAFDSCDNLTYINIPSSVTFIGEDSFYYCKSLTSIDVNPNNNNYSSQDGVLYNKNKTTLIYYPMAKSDFEYTIPDGVETINSRAFYYCKNLNNIHIPDSVVEIGREAFSSSSLKSLEMPDSVINIGTEICDSCWGLTGVTLSENLTYIPRAAFYDCPGLQNITIPNGVYMIGEEAFARTSLINITIPQSVLWVAEGAFIFFADGSIINGVEYNGLENIYYSGTEKQWNNINIEEYNDLFNSNVHYGNVSLYGKCGVSVSWEINNKVLQISGNGRMADYVYPVWLSYDYNAVKVNEGVSYIGEYAFDERIVENGNSYNSFQMNHIKAVSIPKTVKEIGYGAFSDCELLTDVYYAGTKAQWEAIDISSFNSSLLNATIHYNSSMPERFEPLDVRIEHNVLGGQSQFTVTANNTDMAEELPRITLFLAEYDNNGILTNIRKGINGSISENSMSITSELPSSDNYKFMLWDINQYPLMEAITDIY